MLKKLPKTDNYVYHNLKRNGTYQLEKIEDEIIQRFHQLIVKLEVIPQVHLCARGDSKESLEKHEAFFTELLPKIFLVGEKAKSNVSQSSKSEFMQIHNDNKDFLIDQLRKLIDMVNKEVSKNKYYHIKGSISDKFISELEQEDITAINQWKMFFISYLHTIGSFSEFQKYSPYLSVTHGYKKYTIARKFALHDNNRDKGFIFLYALNSGDPYYVIKSRMTKVLKKFGVKWFEDKYSEIMLVNGMFPHYMLGVFEVEKDKTLRFIMNPWLYQTLKNGETFDYVNGLKINQENFTELASSLGYSNFFLMDEKGETYISDIETGNTEKVIAPM